VFTGPIYRDKPDNLEVDADGKRWVKYEVIGDNVVGVPTHYFKIMLAEIDGQILVQTFILPNVVSDVAREDIEWDEFLFSVDEVERRTGLDFFNLLSKRLQKQLEQPPASTAWTLIEEVAG
jgi:endonuclease G